MPFFFESPYVIKTNYRVNNRYSDDEIRLPKFIYMGDSLIYWAITLSRAGYGSVDLLLSYPSDIFMSILYHEVFLNDFSAETRAINRRG